MRKEIQSNIYHEVVVISTANFPQRQKPDIREEGIAKGGEVKDQDNQSGLR